MGARLPLGRKQEIFAEHLSTLISLMFASGYRVRYGEVERSKAEAFRKGFPNSNHTRRLAADLHLFRDGKYLTQTEDHETFGIIWESFSRKIDGVWVQFCWGGRFRDGNHYSIQHGRVK
jgi:hypothetical protein